MPSFLAADVGTQLFIECRRFFFSWLEIRMKELGWIAEVKTSGMIEMMSLNGTPAPAAASPAAPAFSADSITSLLGSIAPRQQELSLLSVLSDAATAGSSVAETLQTPAIAAPSPPAAAPAPAAADSIASAISATDVPPPPAAAAVPAAPAFSADSITSLLGSISSSVLSADATAPLVVLQRVRAPNAAPRWARSTRASRERERVTALVFAY